MSKSIPAGSRIEGYCWVFSIHVININLKIPTAFSSFSSPKIYFIIFNNRRYSFNIFIVDTSVSIVMLIKHTSVYLSNHFSQHIWMYLRPRSYRICVTFALSTQTYHYLDPKIHLYKKLQLKQCKHCLVYVHI